MAKSKLSALEDIKRGKSLIIGQAFSRDFEAIKKKRDMAVKALIKSIKPILKKHGFGIYDDKDTFRNITCNYSSSIFYVDQKACKDDYDARKNKLNSDFAQMESEMLINPDNSDAVLAKARKWQ